MSQEPLLRKREVAQRLNVCERTVDRLIAARQLIATKVGRATRVSPQVLAEFIRRQTRGA